MTVTSVPSSATSVLLAAADGTRTSLTIENKDAADLYIKMGEGPAATAAGGWTWTRGLNAGIVLTPPESYQAFYGIWTSANGGYAEVTALNEALTGDNNAIRTYGELKDAMGNWLRPNGTPSANMTLNIPKYIGMCEAEMNRRLFQGDMRASTAISIVDGVASVPIGFRSVLEMRLTEEPYTKIVFGDASTPESAYPTQTSKPWKARRVGTSFIFEPPTSAGASLIFKRGISALVDDADTNWLLLANPDAYLYGSLIHADKRLAGERLGEWKESFETIMRQMEIEVVMEAIATLRVQPSGAVV